MRKLGLGLAIVFLISFGLAQVGQGNGTLPEGSAPDPGIETAECGDGVCQPVLRGSCPQDCAPENDSENSASPMDLVQENPEIISGGLTVITLSVLVMVLISRRWSKKESRDQLRERINQKLNQRKDVESIKRELKEEGFQQERIQNVLEEEIY